MVHGHKILQIPARLPNAGDRDVESSKAIDV